MSIQILVIPCNVIHTITGRGADSVGIHTLRPVIYHFLADAPNIQHRKPFPLTQRSGLVARPSILPNNQNEASIHGTSEI